MQTLPKRKFTAEFRTQAVKLVRESDVPQAEAARQLGISEHTLATWPKQAKAEIFDYIEVFYNRMRRHSKIGNLAPAEFERRYYAAQKVG